MAEDPRNLSAGLSGPAKDLAAITPNDGADLANPVRAIYVGDAGATGSLKIDTLAGTTITLTGLVAGIMHPIGALKVYATGTDCTGLVGVTE